MEWLIDTATDQQVVVIPDVLIEEVIEAVDIPRGSLPIDPYQDYHLSFCRLPEVLENLKQEIYQRRQIHHQAVMQRLNLKRWEEWAVGVLEDTEQKDLLLNILLQLENLCCMALKEGRDILVFGQ